MGTDFFDDDLVREREAALKIKLDGDGASAARDGHIPSSRDLPNRPVGDLTLTHLARHKQEVTEQMVDKVQELDRLRARQDELERERRLLEEMRQKQEAFDTGRRELKNCLGESLVRMEKERLQAERLAQLLDETRRLFRERLDEVSALDADSWDDENLLDELNNSLGLLENVRADFNRAMAKIEAVQPSGGAPVRAAAFERASAGAEDGVRGFAYWLRAGWAFTLPLMVLLAVLSVVWMALYFLA
jgi:vacuolar-type H+-ATPase subunit I/STV1